MVWKVTKESFQKLAENILKFSSKDSHSRYQSQYYKNKVYSKQKSEKGSWAFPDVAAPES
ncbi:uncharacterized protein CIMG_13335 [Coccidioides immitis RS]|uniref:Uncharacterized protein n=1 Tax=Coccidioides immitis (strain RS) TaxID=246410 RepID=A0A0D8JVH0_COCIM|nr:uncharacterized protein CIMG_13335 [Coccidioides immitis RS]KJF60941.1 hypothetical protein CIMG_13335 [Coccidioides immitis RS]